MTDNASQSGEHSLSAREHTGTESIDTIVTDHAESNVDGDADRDKTSVPKSPEVVILVRSDAFRFDSETFDSARASVRSGSVDRNDNGIDDVIRGGSDHGTASILSSQSIGSLHVCDHTCNCDDE